MSGKQVRSTSCRRWISSSARWSAAVSKSPSRRVATGTLQNALLGANWCMNQRRCCAFGTAAQGAKSSASEFGRPAGRAPLGTPVAANVRSRSACRSAEILAWASNRHRLRAAINHHPCEEPLKILVFSALTERPKRRRSSCSSRCSRSDDSLAQVREVFDPAVHHFCAGVSRQRPKVSAIRA